MKGSLGIFTAVSLGLVGPAVILQALLAPWYVPILLGDGWADLSATVSVLCLAAIPTMLWTAAAGWMRAENRPQHELLGTAVLTGALMLNTVLAAPYGLETIAWGYLATASVTMLVMSWPALRFALVPTLAKA